MRKYILTVAGLAGAVAVAVHFATKATAPGGTAQVGETSAATTNSVQPAATKTVTIADPKIQSSKQMSSAPAAGSPESIAFASDIDTVVSPHSTYGEKQAAWKELLASGRIRGAIAE